MRFPSHWHTLLTKPVCSRILCGRRQETNSLEDFNAVRENTPAIELLRPKARRVAWVNKYCVSPTANESFSKMEPGNARREPRKRPSCVTVVALFFLVLPMHGQTLDPVPGFLQDLAGKFPLPADFSFEQQIQIGTQGNSANGNPFAYGHALQFRPWVHYDGIPN